MHSKRWIHHHTKLSILQARFTVQNILNLHWIKINFKSQIYSVQKKKSAEERLTFFPLRRNSPTWAKTASFLRFLDHTRWQRTFGRTPLHEGSARRRDLITHTTCPRWHFFFCYFCVIYLYFFVLNVLALPFVLTVQHTQHKRPCLGLIRTRNPSQQSGHRPTPLDRSATGIGQRLPLACYKLKFQHCVNTDYNTLTIHLNPHCDSMGQYPTPLK